MTYTYCINLIEAIIKGHSFSELKQNIKITMIDILVNFNYKILTSRIHTASTVASDVHRITYSNSFIPCKNQKEFLMSWGVFEVNRYECFMENQSMIRTFCGCKPSKKKQHWDSSVKVSSTQNKGVPFSSFGSWSLVLYLHDWVKSKFYP